MKKLITLLLAAALVLSLAACGGGNDTPSTDTNTPSGGEDTPDTPEFVTSTDYMTIDGICVDNSYVDDGSPLKLVYLFYTLSSNDENLQIDSVNTELTINDGNTYVAEHLSSTASVSKYMPNYLYSGYIEDVYMGTSINVMATFKIPEADLAAGRTITISDTQIPDVDKILLSTDDIKTFDSAEEIAEFIDPDGYAEVLLLREEADADTTAKVKNLINGCYWSFYVNNTGYEIEFWAENNFEVRTNLGTSNSGTYSVRNGYIFCTYPGMEDKPVEIPYAFTENDIKLELTDAFSVKG